MSARLETSAEVLKLARLLGVDREEIGFLDDVAAEELRALRESVTESLFAQSAQSLARVAAAAKLLPSSLVASIAQRSFGPLLCARAASAVDPAKAIDVARRLSADFLADATTELDPRRVARIIAGVPESIVVPVAAELGRRREYVTMGRFLAFVPDDAIAAAMTALDDEALLRTAFVLEHKERLDHALGLLPPERLPGVLVAAHEMALWPEALDLLDHLSDARRGPVADAVAEQSEAVIEGLVAAVSAAGIWESLLPVVGMMSDSHRVRLAACAAFHSPQILTEILSAAAASDLWADLLPLIDALPVAVRDAAVQQVSAMAEGDVASLVAAVHAADLWGDLLPLVRIMAEPDRERIAAMAPFHTEETLQAIVLAATGSGMWLELVPLIRALPPAALVRIAVIVSNLDLATLESLVGEAMAEADALLPFLDLLSDMDDDGRRVITGVIDGADRSLGELVVRGLTDPEHVRAVVDHAPADLLQAVERAADRVGLRAEYDAAMTAAGQPA